MEDVKLKRTFQSLPFLYVGSLDGGWSEWYPLEPCSVTAGVGVRRLFRLCDSPFPDNGGAQCDGQSSIVRICLGKEGPYGRERGFLKIWIVKWSNQGFHLRFASLEDPEDYLRSLVLSMKQKN